MPNIFVSLPTLAAIGVGIVIAFFYLRYMWLVLQRGSKTLDNPDDGKRDGFAYSFIGAIIAVISSSPAVIGYDFAPQVLYVGIAVTVASTSAVAYPFLRG